MNLGPFWMTVTTRGGRSRVRGKHTSGPQVVRMTGHALGVPSRDSAKTPQTVEGLAEALNPPSRASRAPTGHLRHIPDGRG